VERSITSDPPAQPSDSECWQVCLPSTPSARTVLNFYYCEATMRAPSRKRAPKNLPTAVSDLVAEGGNILAADDAKVSAFTSAETVVGTAIPSKKTRPEQVKQGTVVTRRRAG
jgi:hypothetical protein